MSQIIEWSKGNPGALSFLMDVYGNMRTSIAQASIINAKLERCTSLRGTNLWVLYSDLCDKDMDKVTNLCKFCPDDILEDACSRQDYSGRKLVEKFLEPTEKEDV